MESSRSPLNKAPTMAVYKIAVSGVRCLRSLQAAFESSEECAGAANTVLVDTLEPEGTNLQRP